jgi:hypothetical protein
VDSSANAVASFQDDYFNAGCRKISCGSQARCASADDQD